MTKRRRKREEGGGGGGGFRVKFQLLSRLLPENRQGGGGERKGCSKCDRSSDVRRSQQQLGLTRENRRSLRAISSRRSPSPPLSIFLFASPLATRGPNFSSRSPFSIDRHHPPFLREIHFYFNFSLGLNTMAISSVHPRLEWAWFVARDGA